MVHTRFTLATFGLLCFWSADLSAQAPSFERWSTERGIAHVSSFTPDYGHGMSAEDFDGDGDIDFFLATATGIPARLYQNDGKGYFTDIAQASGILDTGATRTALWVDVDGDGLLDLIVAGENCPDLSCDNPVYLKLYRQDTKQQFHEISQSAGLDPGDAFDKVIFFAVGGMAAGDLTGNGYPDLILTVWGGGILFFANNGDGTFSDKTEGAGLTMELETPWQPLLYDFNRDGLLDIYCNVDFSPNKLWINTGDGKFEDRAAGYGLNNAFNEMGIAAADADNDGDLDLYVTNITRNYRGIEQHNLYYEQKNTGQGNLAFAESAQNRGIGSSGWDWGTTWADLNNDGRVDLLTTNGWESPDWAVDRSRCWLNTLSGFVDVSFASRFNDPFNATTLLSFDMDNDGDLDVFQTLKDKTSSNPVLIYENKLVQNPERTNYLRLLPRKPGSNLFPAGTTVTLKAGTYISTRLITAGTSYYGQEPAEAFFGLGAITEIDEVMVVWPGNEVSIYKNLSVNTAHTLVYDFLEAPVNLRVAGVAADGSISLSWDDRSEEEEGFELEQSTNALFFDSESFLLPANAGTFTLPAPESGQSYYFRVRAFNERVWSDDSNSISVQPELLPDPEEYSRFKIYPNPAGRNEVLHIELGFGFTGKATLRWFDSLGRLLSEAVREGTGDRNKMEIRTPESAGIYWLSVLGDKDQWLNKLVVTGNE